MIGNFVIYGDSYSTYKGYIPQGYPTYYTPDEVPPTDTVFEENWRVNSACGLISLRVMAARTV